MMDIHPLMKSFMEPGETDFQKAKFPTLVVEKMLDTTNRMALEKGHSDEREELVCRLLANAMTIDEISVVLKIRKDAIVIIERENVEKIAEYNKKLKARRKKQEP